MQDFGSRLAGLRALMKDRGINAWIAPRADAFQGEYVPPSAMRLAFLTGFSGSAGVAVATADKAALFVDGRYTLQAAGEVDAALFEIHLISERSPQAWLMDNLASGDLVGFDPWLHTAKEIARFSHALEPLGVLLAPMDENPLDVLWTDRPAPPKSTLRAHPLEYAGVSSAEKRMDAALRLKGRDQAAQLISAPDSLAWLLNVRGHDIPFTPVVLCFALLYDDATLDLFIDESRLTPEALEHMGPDIRIRPPDGLGAALAALTGKKVRLDPDSAAMALSLRLEEAGAIPAFEEDLCALPKAVKNVVEQNGARAAHLRDAIALNRFLAWIAAEAPKGTVTEIDAAQKLDSLRAELPLHQEPSFETISATGPNSAVTHYRVSPQSSLTLQPGQLYLVDSGGQYLDGTTDVTRTVAIGPVGAEERKIATLALKGHIALASARFPKGTTGSQLDALARRPLWDEGFEFDHGTGHGVGSFLSVHEGPQRISKLPNPTALTPGMVLSNEPGYYRAGAFGIRIENLLMVRPGEEIDGRSWLSFETLTFAPYDRALIDPALLTDRERDWINVYHARTREKIAPSLDGDDLKWLIAATRTLPA